MTVKAIMPVRINLVAPLAHKVTATRTTDTAGFGRARSGAVAPLIGRGLRQGDVDSAKGRPTPATRATPGTRTSTTATRTTTTRTMSSEPAPSADRHDANHAGPSFEDLLRAKHYIRYVDDFLLLHESREWLVATLAEIAAFLPRELHVQLNPAKTILQPIERGIDFVGQVLKPWHRRIRRRTFNEALSRTAQVDAGEVFATANSYFGLLRQATASLRDRALLANLARRRGHAVNAALTKTYRGRA
jgi:hypothetical protein